MKISGKGALNEGDHSPAKILYLATRTSTTWKFGRAAGESDRDRLYESINSDDVILSDDA